MASTRFLISDFWFLIKLFSLFNISQTHGIFYSFISLSLSLDGESCAIENSLGWIDRDDFSLQAHFNDCASLRSLMSL
jgi:hypothetical protein